MCRSLRAQGDGDLHDLTVELAIAGPVVRVRAHAEVTAVFGRLLPGYGQRGVSAEATAVSLAAGAVPTGTPAALVPIAC